MTDDEMNYRAMARQTLQKLTDYRSTWEPAAPRMVPDFVKVQGLVKNFDDIGTTLGGTGSKGYTDAKDKAEDVAVAAAMRIVKGLRTIQLNGYRPELAKAAGYDKSDLERLRDENLVTALEAIAKAAATVADELADERVKAEQLKALDDALKAYRPLVGTPRGQIIVGSTLRTTAKKLVAQLREAFGPIDTRMDNLGEEEEFEAMVAEYRKARHIVDAGHGPHGPALAAA